MEFLHDDFLLRGPTAKRLYHDVAKDLPIIDYHCHLPPKDLAENRRFDNLFEAWLEGDHYKWRAMRSNGVTEDFCTGDADPYDKFLAFAKTVPHTIRNPLYHWTHLELKRYFGFDGILNEKSAPKVWEMANEQLTGGDLDVAGILKKFKVEIVCTTDDPADSLEYHQQLAGKDFPAKVFPAFRPDKVLAADKPEVFNTFVDSLSARVNSPIDSLDTLLRALGDRHEFFHSMGCRLSDHGLSWLPAHDISTDDAKAIFAKVRSGEAATAEEAEGLATYLMIWMGEKDFEKGWTRQFHLGAMRNNSSRLFRNLGPDTGFDSIGDWPQAERLSRHLDLLDTMGKLPRTILYNLNPNDNYVFGTMIGNFQDGTIPGKIQFGSGWWFNDQIEGMEAQMNALSNLGLLSRFVGMLTDSRSFLSFPRHEYFRRILCNLVGRDVDEGLIPNDPELIDGLVRRVSYENARDYFGFPA
ncbi:glucuronate isomerase [Puniceicoccus vermicola]|uniref:Uronate isomerase n=1 Tax=Puniceicoccus vermicola TaxID=388746 RepID=A0A7X1AXV8_9BACT|nr:glucuronate isomerase [Puniceicoccus vermicola]MBC2601907.1 glucuronate isomerase [Puniceicoccus vermicola]